MPDIVLDQYAPGGCMKQLGDAAGGIVYDQYVPGGAMGQLYETSGMTDPPNQYAPGGVFGQIEQELEGGGSSVPDWVPINAVIHIDLVGGDPQGRAWVAGTGEVAVDTLLGSDANATTSHGDTEYDPAGLVEGGYSQMATANPDRGVAFIGAAKTAVLAGATVAVEFKGIGEFNEVAVVDLCSTTGMTGIQVKCMGNGASVNCSDFVAEFFLELLDVLDIGVSAVNRIAMTVGPTRVEFAVNGSAVAETAVTDTSWPTSGPDAIVAAVAYDAYEQDNYLHFITIYDPLPSTAGLSELSEVT